MTKWRVRFACWITKVTDTRSEYVIIISSPLQQWLHECASMLRYMYIACLVSNVTIYKSAYLTRCCWGLLQPPCECHYWLKRLLRPDRKGRSSTVLWNDPGWFPMPRKQISRLKTRKNFLKFTSHCMNRKWLTADWNATVRFWAGSEILLLFASFRLALGLYWGGPSGRAV